MTNNKKLAAGSYFKLVLDGSVARPMERMLHPERNDAVLQETRVNADGEETATVIYRFSQKRMEYHSPDLVSVTPLSGMGGLSKVPPIFHPLFEDENLPLSAYACTDIKECWSGIFFGPTVAKTLPKPLRIRQR